MYAIRLKGSNLFVYRTPNTHLLNEGAGSTWKNKPDISNICAQGPWIKKIARALNIEITEMDDLDRLTNTYGDDLFEVVEVEFVENRKINLTF